MQMVKNKPQEESRYAEHQKKETTKSNWFWIFDLAV